MKNIKKTVAISLIIMAACQLSMVCFAVNARYGASAVEENHSYTVAQMLTYAIEDEYLANARYTMDIEKFGDQRPFTRFVLAEKRHIGLLKPLFAKYNVPIPDDIAAQYVVVPDSLLAAMKAGAAGEDDNKDMYEVFLKQQLPEDIKYTFSVLKYEAERHEKVFERIMEGLEGASASTRI